jgi:1A family penicillin-binding protein
VAAAGRAQEAIAAYPLAPTGVAPITVVDRNGKYVGRILPQKRYWVPLERIPGFLQQALLAVEDARFYEHGGIDLRGIARAVVKDVLKGRLAEGGSTITQQLIKNKFLSSEVSIDRKVKEAKMAMEFEKKYSKRQILEMYFNEIYYGNGAYGLAQAARLYFNKSAEDLNESECVMLAGVPKNPGRYNPQGKPADLAARREVVLKRLAELNIRTSAQIQAIRARPAAVQGASQAPAYLNRIRDELVRQYGPEVVEHGGLDVVAAMDLGLQKQAERALVDGVHRLTPGLQGALVAMDPATGDVLAAVGGVDGGAAGLNRAFNSRRQTGSSIKPIIYAAALEQGITAASLWSDAAVAYTGANGRPWKPRNYGREVFGEQNLHQALAHSNNVITVKLLEQVGVPRLVAFGEKLGLNLPAQNGLSLALGTADVSLDDLVQAYTPLAAGGVLARERTILKVHERRTGNWIDRGANLVPALDPGAAFIATRMLGDVMTYGTAKSLRRFHAAHPSAGKTGTTDDFVDAWFVGYTPNLVTGVWVGFDQPRPVGGGFTGGAAAAPIWERFMTRAVATRPAQDFVKPDNVVAAVIDPSTGQLATPTCPERYEEYFLAGTEPRDGCLKHGGTPAAPLPEPTPIPTPAPEPAPASEPVPAAPDAPDPNGPEPTSSSQQGPDRVIPAPASL